MNKSKLEEGTDLIIVDTLSMARLGDSSETTKAEWQSAFLPKVVGPVRSSNTALVYFNTFRKLENASHTVRALKYYASLRVELSVGDVEYKPSLGEGAPLEPLCKVIHARNIKCMVSDHQGHSTDFVIRYGEGIDNVRSIIDIAQAKGFVTPEGSGFTLDGVEGYFTDKEVLRAFFKSHPQRFKALVDKMNTAGTEQA